MIIWSIFEVYSYIALYEVNVHEITNVDQQNAIRSFIILISITILMDQRLFVSMFVFTCMYICGNRDLRTTGPMSMNPPDLESASFNEVQQSKKKHSRCTGRWAPKSFQSPSEVIYLYAAMQVNLSCLPVYLNVEFPEFSAKCQ